MPILPGAEPFSYQGGRVGVLLCHGFTGTPQSMRPWGEHLAAAGMTVRCPLLPGHGTRWQDMNATGWPDWYGVVEAELTSIGTTCDTVFVAGLSMGGTLAVRLAEQHPEAVAGLVLVNPSLGTQRLDARLLPLLAKVLPAYKGVAGDIKKPGGAEVAYGLIPLKAAMSLRALWELTRADLPRVTAPLLLFRSAVDHVVEAVSSEWLLAGVASADTEERVLADSFHVATLDNDAPTILDGSVAWIRARSTASRPGPT
ncbi:MAG: alpha/beta fold hydrolase [Geodermatophilaceae bacterium]|nr:alpha/beta fold hydrolase [Geodermatophilaceae bacterium]